MPFCLSMFVQIYSYTYINLQKLWNKWMKKQTNHWQLFSKKITFSTDSDKVWL